MPKHFCFIQQHRFICLHASVGFQLSKRRTWVMPFFENDCWCWLVWNSNIVDVDSVVECYKKRIPLRETEAHWHQLHRWQECKTGVGSRLAIRGIKRCLDSWKAEGVTEKHRMLSRDMFIHVNKINLRIGKQPSDAVVSAVDSQQGLGRRHFCVEFMLSPLLKHCSQSHSTPAPTKCRHTHMHSPATRLEVGHFCGSARTRIAHSRSWRWAN